MKAFAKFKSVLRTALCSPKIAFSNSAMVPKRVKYYWIDPNVKYANVMQ